MNSLTRIPSAVQAAQTATTAGRANARDVASTEAAAPGSRRTLHLAELLGDAQGIDIDHNGYVYRLQITKAGRLILTK